MYKYSKSSLRKLESCCVDLQIIFMHVIRICDVTILWGHRQGREQNQLFKAGKSKVLYPNSKHNSTPSKAIDVAPYPINWKDLFSFYYLGGLVKGIALERGIGIRWGGDWDSDNDFNDQTFNDLCHFEVIL